MNNEAPQPSVVPASDIAAMFAALGDLLDLLRDIDDLFDSANFDFYFREIQRRLLPCLEAFDACFSVVDNIVRDRVGESMAMDYYGDMFDEWASICGFTYEGPGYYYAFDPTSPDWDEIWSDLAACSPWTAGMMFEAVQIRQLADVLFASAEQAHGYLIPAIAALMVHAEEISALYEQGLHGLFDLYGPVGAAIPL